jgi:uncharacterized protein YciI
MFAAVSTYLAPLGEVDRFRRAHHRWVEQLYRNGVVLVSGRREPPAGGVIVATADSEEAMVALLDSDPFVVAGVARYMVYAFSPADGPLRSPAFEQFSEAARAGAG